MTITNPKLNRRLEYLERAAEVAPQGTYEMAKRAVTAIEEASDALRQSLIDAGFVALNDDRLRNLEVAIYGYLLEGNPDAYGLMTAEGFGEHIDGPAGERVRAEATRDRDFIASIQR